jgi:hypothetical protein
MLRCLKVTVWEAKDSIPLVQDIASWAILVNTVMNLRVPQMARKLLKH